jgi:predicted nucleic acid-binding protein
MILLDTNVLSEFMKPSPSIEVVQWINRTPASELRVCSITRAEIELGVALMPEGKRRQTALQSAHETFKIFAGRCLPFGEHAAIVFAAVFAHRKKAGHPISTEDAQIASIALVHDMKLATRNSKDFRLIKGLELINPWIA